MTSRLQLSKVVALGSLIVAVGGSGFFSWTGLLLGATGALVFIAGLLLEARRAVSAGAFVVAAGGIMAGVEQAPVLVVLVAVAATVVAWDVGRFGMSLRRQLGDDAPTISTESVHAAMSVGAGAAAVTIGYGLFQFGAEGETATAVVFLLLASVLLVVALR